MVEEIIEIKLLQLKKLYYQRHQESEENKERLQIIEKQINEVKQNGSCV